jgi:hypothetical protein
VVQQDVADDFASSDALSGDDEVNVVRGIGMVAFRLKTLSREAEASRARQALNSVACPAGAVIIGLVA